MKIRMRANCVLSSNTSNTSGNNSAFSYKSNAFKMRVKLIGLEITVDAKDGLISPSIETLRADKQTLLELTKKLSNGSYFLMIVMNNVQSEITVDNTIISDDAELTKIHNFNNYQDFLNFFNTLIEPLIQPVQKIKPKL